MDNVNTADKQKVEAPPQQPPEPKMSKLEFYILEKDMPKVDEFIEMAFATKLITEKSLQAFMQLCFNCAAGYILQEVKRL